jgi:toxin-antitoxin system PIN domain toxin
VILVDINLLVYATNTDAPRHPAAYEWLARELAGATRVGLPWMSLLGFLRIATNPHAFPRVLTIEVAWRQVENWLSCDSVWIPQPTERHAEVLRALLAQPGMRSNLVPDAHLAALAIEHGLTLCSTDGDFGRFRELKWHNPLLR